ncbi:MAG: LPP20 family lipoprotein [Planctomycetes bacterium]|nr:LPP20 family lipoprotein [Planctomycetota bacterium]
MPGWVWSVPYDEQYLYGRGTYAHSLYPEDNEKNAREEALTSLARQIRTHVKDLLVMRGTSDSASMDRLTRLVADNVIEGAQHVETWTDWDGVVRVDGHDHGRVWVLVRMEKERVLAAARSTSSS